jgi:hypothetical protein
LRSISAYSSSAVGAPLAPLASFLGGSSFFGAGGGAPFFAFGSTGAASASALLRAAIFF